MVGRVSDAEYLVIHQGRQTIFHVNQQMGGGTWVYLGTFDFDKGCDKNNRVVVSNLSEQDGYVTTDAVRFGGGMGNIQRGGQPQTIHVHLKGLAIMPNGLVLPTMSIAPKLEPTTITMTSMCAP